MTGTRNVENGSNRQRAMIGLLAILLLAAGQAVAVEVRQAVANSEEMLFADDPKDWARPKAVVAPKYPDDQLKLNARGRVDVDVALKPSGEVSSFRIAKSEPANPAFETAVSEVVGKWLFHNKLSSECLPVESNGNVRVWFDVKDGKGEVSVSGQVSEITAGNVPKKSNWLNRSEAISGFRYPAAARRADVQAKVNVVVRVDGKSGDVLDVGVPWMETQPESVPDRMAADFRAAASEVMKRAKFEPQAGSTYRVCMPFEFRVQRL
jgi:TonB family protein